MARKAQKKIDPLDKKPTPLEENYAQHFVRYGNKTKALRKFYDTSHMTEGSVWALAYEVANRPHVKLRIQRLRDLAQKRNALSLDQVIAKITDVATFDLADIYDEDGNLASIHDMPTATRNAILSIRTDRHKDSTNATVTTKEIKTLNRLDALKELVKIFGGYEEHNKQKTALLSKEERTGRIAELKSKLAVKSEIDDNG